MLRLRATRTITFATATVNLVVAASPSMPAESFRITGMTDPAISVAPCRRELRQPRPGGARVSIELVIPAFTRWALWFLSELTASGMHAGTLTFTATTPGSYQYLCHFPATRATA